MIIKTLSNERGIIALYDGDKYIIFSTAYGVVAESTKIEREVGDDYIERRVHIEFDICEWLGYWDLYRIIRRGVPKMEREYISKEVDIELHQVKGEQMYLRRNLIISTEKY